MRTDRVGDRISAVRMETESSILVIKDWFLGDIILAFCLDYYIV